MTYEQLKEQADALGYRLVKKQKRVRISPCLCGAKRGIEMRYSTYGKFLRCSKCYLGGPPGETVIQAKIEWNNMVESMRGDQSVQ